MARLKRHSVYFHPLQPFSDCYLVGPLVPFEVFEDEQWAKAGVRRWRIGQKSKSGSRIYSNDTYDDIEEALKACASAPTEGFLALVEVHRNDPGVVADRGGQAGSLPYIKDGAPVVRIRRREYERFLFDLRSPIPKAFELSAAEKRFLVQGVEVYRTPAIQATQELPLQDLIDEVRLVASRLGHFPTVIDFRWHSRLDHKTLMKRLKLSRWSAGSLESQFSSLES